MNPWRRFLGTRWGWFLSGLPVPARAWTLFKIKRATMTTPRRCKVLWNQCMDLFGRGVPGSLVECGVWRGGSSGVMALASRHAKQIRHLHLFDSFEGLPEPKPIDEQGAADYSAGRATGKLASIDRCKAEIHEVENFLFGELGLPRDRIRFHVGWFQSTVPRDADQLGPIALLRLDGDWYESTMICLKHLYPKLSPGGLIILDDYYAWAGCRKATDEYREAQGIREPLIRIDVDAAYWIKK